MYQRFTLFFIFTLMTAPNLGIWPGSVQGKQGLSPKEWNDYNRSLGYLPVNGPRPSVYSEYRDPKKNYEQIVNGKKVKLPYISYTNTTPIAAPTSNRTAVDFSNQGYTGYKYGDGSIKYLSNTDGSAMPAIVQQYAKGGRVGYAAGGGISFNERYAAANAANAEMNQQQNPNGSQKAPRNYGQYTQALGGAAMGVGNSMYQNVAPEQDQQTRAINSTIDSTAASVTPWYGLAKGASDIGRSQLKRDQYGNVVGTDRGLDEFMAPMHQNAMDAYKREGIGGAAKEFFTPAAAIRGVTDLIDRGDETSGFFGALNKFSGNTAKNKAIQDQKDAAAAQVKADQDSQNKELKDSYDARVQGKIDSRMALRDLGVTDYQDYDQFNSPDYLKQAGVKPSRSRHEELQAAIGSGGGQDSSGVFMDAVHGAGDAWRRMFKEGGKIIGKGTGKSDSINAEIEDGSFIVPAEHAGEAEFIRKAILGKPVKKATLHQKGKTPVKVSAGEHLFTKEETEELLAAGVDVDELAPHAQNALRCGGYT